MRRLYSEHKFNKRYSRLNKQVQCKFLNTEIISLEKCAGIIFLKTPPPLQIYINQVYTCLLIHKCILCINHPIIHQLNNNIGGIPLVNAELFTIQKVKIQRDSQRLISGRIKNNKSGNISIFYNNSTYHFQLFQSC